MSISMAIEKCPHCPRNVIPPQSAQNGSQKVLIVIPNDMIKSLSVNLTYLTQDEVIKGRTQSNPEILFDNHRDTGIKPFHRRGIERNTRSEGRRH